MIVAVVVPEYGVYLAGPEQRNSSVLVFLLLLNVPLAGNWVVQNLLHHLPIYMFCVL